MNEEILEEWPEVPENQRPKILPINYLVSQSVQESLEKRGWKLVDIRLCSDRKERVQNTLEGIGTGSIRGDKDIVRFLELEMRALGLYTGKQSGSDEPADALGDTLEECLDFTSHTKVDKIDVQAPKRPGRPRGAKDRLPRTRRVPD